jgi:hypothetical protein
MTIRLFGRVAISMSVDRAGWWLDHYLGRHYVVLGIGRSVGLRDADSVGHCTWLIAGPIMLQLVFRKLTPKGGE